MSVEEDIQELRDALAALRSENLGLKARLSDVEDFAQTHIGMDWGQAGTDANAPHPNLSIDAAEYGGGVMRLNRYGDQVLMKTDGLIRPGLYFVKRLYSAEADFTSGDQQTTFGAGYSSTTAFSTWATYFTRDNILSGPFAYITEYARSASNGDPSAEILIAADYDGDGNAAELRVKEDSSGNLTYKIHKGSGVYVDIGGGMNKVTGSGYLVMPAAASGIDPAVGGGAWTSGAWSQVLASTSEADSIIGIMAQCDDTTNALAEFEVDIGTGGAGAETVVATIPFSRSGQSLAGVETLSPTFFPAPIEVATSTRVAVRYRTSDTTVELKNMKLVYTKASELVAR